MFQRRQRERNLGVLLLAYHILGSGPIPPVTLVSVLFQIAVFLDFVPGFGPGSTRKHCLIATRVLQNKEYLRLVAPVFMHADDMHLYYNMISMIWKGRRLERSLGGLRFAIVILLFVFVCPLITIALSVGLDQFGPMVFPDMHFEYSYQCAVGFSGVLFALKVLSNHYFPNEDQLLMGWLPIPSKWASWAELILIQLVTPNASFVGHLAGILTGLLYIQGPLKFITETLYQIITNDPGSAYPRTRFTGTYGGATGHAGDGYAGEGTSSAYRRPPSAPVYEEDVDWSEYTGGLSEEEQLRLAREESLRQRFR